MNRHERGYLLVQLDNIEKFGFIVTLNIKKGVASKFFLVLKYAPSQNHTTALVNLEGTPKGLWPPH